MSIRQRRMNNGWSQSQLAEFCGLSLRTVQRIEKGQKPTMESLKALASVFETNISALISNHEIDESKLTEQETEALKHVRKMKRFLLELFSYIVIVPLVCLATWIFGHGIIWGGLTALVWGILLAYDALYIFDASDFLGSGWEKRQLEKRLGRNIQ
ncbi:MAG: helix-turn-helix domain-containing protein [Colwellia sp.]|nr:helix-turn-helix domain-containing protein [Colwellia sp.]